MNVYLIQEECEPRCVQANNMQEAVTIATQHFSKENYDDSWDLDETPDAYYQRCILQSCTFLGELINP